METLAVTHDPRGGLEDDEPLVGGRSLADKREADRTPRSGKASGPGREMLHAPGEQHRERLELQLAEPLICPLEAPAAGTDTTSGGLGAADVDLARYEG